MDDMVLKYAFKLLSVSPSLLLAYLGHRKYESQCLQVWQVLLSDISRHPDVAETSIKPLLNAVEGGSLPSYLKPSTGEVNVLIGHLLSEVLAGNPTHSTFVRQVLLSPGTLTHIRSIHLSHWVFKRLLFIRGRLYDIAGKRSLCIYSPS